MKTKIYLIGAAKTSTQEELHKTVDLFEQAAKALEENGYQVENIMWLAGWHELGERREADFRISKLLKCDEAFLLPNWMNSNMSAIEVLVASRMGIKITHLTDTFAPGRMYIQVETQKINSLNHL